MNIKDKQQILLFLLKQFDQFATKYNIVYFAASGTCLGAVREKGFIQWDGDIDIILPLPMYEKAESLMMSNSFEYIKWVSYKTDSSAPNLMGRIYSKEASINNIEEYPYIDLFALVGMPDEVKDQTKLMKRSLRNYRIFWIKQRKYAKSLNRKKSRIGLVLKCMLLFYPKKQCIKKFEKEMSEFSYEESTCVAPLTGLYGQKEVLPKEWFQQKPLRIAFEDYSVPVLENCHEYLIHMYGEDYLVPKQFARYRQIKEK